jgi:3,4-dihydroxy 2-butanone 4-phosphate synthase/GTP cyclohydrolase II
VEAIIAQFRNGRIVVLADASDQQSQGDLVIPAQLATPDAINFMAKHGRGLICLAITRERADVLGLDYMVKRNRSRSRSAFTASIEAKDGISTGISAADRARTIATAINPEANAGDIVSPGHVFPLVARDGGVLVRAATTEAAVDLARLAGLHPAAVICEILRDDGRTASGPDLWEFAVDHGLEVGSISDLIAYRMRHERLVKAGPSKQLATRWGDFDFRVYVSQVDGGEHMALVKGDIGGADPVLVRVHVAHPLQDLFGAGEASASSRSLEKAMSAVAAAGRGVVVILGGGEMAMLSDWLKLSTAEKSGKEEPARLHVETGIGSQILQHLGITRMILLTSGSAPAYAGLGAYGLEVVETRRL